MVFKHFWWLNPLVLSDFKQKKKKKGQKTLVLNDNDSKAKKVMIFNVFGV